MDAVPLDPGRERAPARASGDGVALDRLDRKELLPAQALLGQLERGRVMVDGAVDQPAGSLRDDEREHDDERGAEVPPLVVPVPVTAPARKQERHGGEREQREGDEQHDARTVGSATAARRTRSRSTRPRPARRSA